MIANYWNNLNERERWLATIGSFCVLLYLFYFLLYSPLTKAVSTKSKQLIEKQETLAWMQQVRQQPKNLTAAKMINNAKLLTIIGNQLNNNMLRQFVYHLQQTGAGDIQLSYDQVPYNQFLSWLWTLKKDYAVALKQINVERTDRPGVVKIMLVIAAKDCDRAQHNNGEKVPNGRMMSC